MKNSMIKRDKGVSCDVDVCMALDSYYIHIDGNSRWLCKDHMQELINRLQIQLDVISEKDI